MFSFFRCSEKNCPSFALKGGEKCFHHSQNKKDVLDLLLSDAKENRIIEDENLANVSFDSVDFSSITHFSTMRYSTHAHSPVWT